MSENASHAEVKIGSERGFGIVFAIVFAIIGLFPLWSGGSIRIWALVIAAIFVALAFIVPQVLKPLNKAWFKFGLFLGGIIAPIVMGLLYFLVVTPTGFVMQTLLGKDLLRTKLDPEAKSYWIKRESPMAPFKNQF